MDANIISGISAKAITLFHNPRILLLGVVLIGITILIMYFFKHFIVNSIIGVVGLFILSAIGIKLPFIITLIVTAIFGLAGLGVMLILTFFGAI